MPESCSQPDVVLMSADGSNDKGVVKRNYHLCPPRQFQSASPHEFVNKRLSSSAAEVQIPHSDDDEKYSLNAFHSGGLLESTHSLTYLEWVHERQTRRMRTRSEWFLLPAASAKDSGTSELNTSVFSSTNLLQTSAVNSSDGRTGSSDNTNECLINLTPKLSLSKSFKESCAASISGQFPPAAQPVTSSESQIAGGIVRRRSWRTHYVRPDRIVEKSNKKRDASEVAIVSSRSAPLFRRNVPHACSRNLPSAGPSIMITSSLTELQQQRQQRSRTPSLEYEKRHYTNIDSGGSISHGRESEITSQSKNVHL
ncbi:unnamed protein product [Onchocerca ochengi]|uniref:Uncharacterized protein n=2 Tax=Onchocerca TaxID=6281 RepID=A0A2K6VHS4_ONCVO|nr:unnamed protein product [Onchocerca ochengi]